MSGRGVETASLKVQPLPLGGGELVVRCPPDKSVTHRGFLFSLLTKKTMRVKNPLLGEDCLASLAAVEKLGAVVRRGADAIEIRGIGVTDFPFSSSADKPLLLDCQNSGTTMRLLTGILAGQKGYLRLIGDASLMKRPMGRVSEPLAKMGAQIAAKGVFKNSPCPPVEISPAANGLLAQKLTLSVASAQVKSAILLAGLWCDGQTQVTEPSPSRDHTERLLAGMGAPVERKVLASGHVTASVSGIKGKSLEGLEFTVGGDPSSAAFWACAAVMQRKKITITHVLLNPTRLGFAEVLKRMGVSVSLEETSNEGGESVGRVVIDATSCPVGAAEVQPPEVPSMVDEIPILALTALWAEGTSVFRGVQELRVKESDRLEAILAMIKTLGGKAWAQGNDLHVEGSGARPRGPETSEWSYETLGDHRLAMSAVIVADALQREIVLDDADCIKVSYPGFFNDRKKLA